MAALRSPAGRPELFRQLRQSDLFFLIPYQEDLEGETTITGGDRLVLISWHGSHGEYVPVFTSERQATWAMKSRREEEEPAYLAQMKGEVFFTIMATRKDAQVIINPGCPLGEARLIECAIKGLATGSILRPVRSVEEATEQMIIMDPADYPTNFIQPLFEFLRGRPEVAAAWIFRQEPPTPPATVRYRIGLHITGPREQVQQDFVLVAKAARPPNVEFGVTVLDPTHPDTARMMRGVRPFYRAAVSSGPG